MVQERVVLDYIVSNKGIEVDKAKVEVTEKLPPLTSITGVRSFLRHVVSTGGSLKIFRKLQKLLPNCLSRMYF